tara:strand:- start:986 stop:1243 length:258 start_codon:yes stop_codon:yes gene_type:complete
MSNHYTYAICNVAKDLPKFNFNEVITTSAETIRKSVDGTLFVTKWMSEPKFVTDGTVTPSATMNHEEALTLMATDAWTNKDGIGK